MELNFWKVWTLHWLEAWNVYQLSFLKLLPHFQESQILYEPEDVGLLLEIFLLTEF